MDIAAGPGNMLKIHGAKQTGNVAGDPHEFKFIRSFGLLVEGQCQFQTQPCIAVLR